MDRRTILGASATFLATGLPALGDQPVPLKIGKVTRHAAKFVDRSVTVMGYPLSLAPPIYFSDEATGKIGLHDLAVTGPGLDQLQAGHKYVLTGNFVRATAVQGNGSPYVLELSAPPAELK